MYILPTGVFSWIIYSLIDSIQVLFVLWFSLLPKMYSWVISPNSFIPLVSGIVHYLADTVVDEEKLQ